MFCCCCSSVCMYAPLCLVRHACSLVFIHPPPSWLLCLFSNAVSPSSSHAHHTPRLSYLFYTPYDRHSSPYRATAMSRACRARIFNRIAAAALCPARLDFPPPFSVSASRLSPIRRRDLSSRGARVGKRGKRESERGEFVCRMFVERSVLERRVCAYRER